MDSYRFTKPATNKRPYKSHLYFVKGIKIGRQIRFFHKLNLLQWIRLEADTDVVGYCERPIEVNHENIKNTVVDFWVKRKNGEEIQFIQKSESNNTISIIAEDYAFNTWLDARKMELHILKAGDIESESIFLANWQTILHFLGSNYDLVKQSLIENVLSALKSQSEITLQSTIDTFPTEDPVLIQTAVLKLLHDGTLSSTELADSKLSLTTKFMIS